MSSQPLPPPYPARPSAPPPSEEREARRRQEPMWTPTLEALRALAADTHRGIEHNPTREDDAACAAFVRQGWAERSGRGYRLTHAGWEALSAACEASDVARRDARAALRSAVPPGSADAP